jgi:hypothetical protein
MSNSDLSSATAAASDIGLDAFRFGEPSPGSCFNHWLLHLFLVSDDGVQGLKPKVNTPANGTTEVVP